MAHKLFMDAIKVVSCLAEEHGAVGSGVVICLPCFNAYGCWTAGPCNPETARAGN